MNMNLKIKGIDCRIDVAKESIREIECYSHKECQSCCGMLVCNCETKSNY